MQAKMIHPETNEEYIYEIPDLTPEELNRMSKVHTRDKDLRMHIERLPVSAEAKVLLTKLASYAIEVGGTIVRIGKKILEFIIMLAKKYSHTTFAIILAALLILLISMVPLIGGVLSTFLAPILVIFGLTMGLWEDLKKSQNHTELVIDIEKAASDFSPLQKKQDVP